MGCKPNRRGLFLIKMLSKSSKPIFFFCKNIKLVFVQPHVRIYIFKNLQIEFMLLQNGCFQLKLKIYFSYDHYSSLYYKGREWDKTG